MKNSLYSLFIALIVAGTLLSCSDQIEENDNGLVILKAVKKLISPINNAVLNFQLMLDQLKSSNGNKQWQAKR